VNKTYRQGQILRLIKNRKIHTQEQLAQELATQEISATQVTLSRDIRELGLVKTPEGYRQMQATTGPASNIWPPSSFGTPFRRKTF
jgi:transcriptional regulator of arginine metabolism